MFLQELLPHLGIQDVTVRTQERIAFNQEEKFCVLDILAKDSRDKRFDIEMQVASQDDLDKRARYYMFKLMEDGFLRQGEVYSQLTATFVIFILPFDPKGKGFRTYSFVYSAKEDKSIELDDESEIIYLNSKGKKGKVSQGIEALYRLMEGKKTSNGKFITRIKKTINNYRKTEEWKDHVMNTKEIAELARKMGLESGLEEGREKGREEGRKEGQQEATIAAIYKVIDMLKRKNESDNQILQDLKLDYGDDFSDEQLEKFLRQS